MIRISRFLGKIDAVLVSIALLSSFLRSFIPVSLELNSPHDDLLGANLTRSLLDGNWLGPWNNKTFAKPPGYSFFLYFAHYVPIDITLLTHVLYLAIAFYLSRLLAQVFVSGQRTTVLRCAFLLFAFNPAVFAADFSRVHRITLCTLLVLLFVSLNLAFLIHWKAWLADRTSRKAKSRLLRNSAFQGLVYSFLILTRVESYWILAVPFLCLGMSLISTYRVAPPPDHPRWPALKLAGIGSVFFIASYLAPVLIIGTVNKSVYGVREVENYFSGNFARAITLWASVDEGRSERTFVSVSKAQRAAVYQVSPTAKSLSPHLDGPPNIGWKILNCKMTNVCDESGNWFPWELRDAAVEAADIKSEVEFQSFFGTIADDISSACRSHLLTCGSRGPAPGSQPLDHLPKTQVLDTAVKVLISLVNVDQAQNASRTVPTDADLELLPYWHWVVHFRYVRVVPGVSDWQVFPHAVEFLRLVYRVMMPIGLLLFTFSMMNPGTDGTQRTWMLAVLIATLVFVLGLSLFELALGFTATYSLYALPAQPLILVFVISGVLDVVITRWRPAEGQRALP